MCLLKRFECAGASGVFVMDKAMNDNVRIARDRVFFWVILLGVVASIVSVCLCFLCGSGHICIFFLLNVARRDKRPSQRESLKHLVQRMDWRILCACVCVYECR